MSSGMSTLETVVRSVLEVLSRNRHDYDREPADYSHGEGKGQVEEVKGMGPSVRLRRGGDTEAHEQGGTEDFERAGQ